MNQVKKDTYCPFLWNCAFIDSKGDVFACCHKKPSVIGNIKQDKLENIYNSGTMQMWRKKSLDGQLECHKSCVLINESKTKDVPKELTVDYAKNLKKLKIEFGELCNIQCVMCPQDHKSRVMLDSKSLIANINLQPFNSIEIQGGEPLAIPEAKIFFDHVASLGKKPFFLTNGLLLTDEWIQKIVHHSSFIYISLNGATQRVHEKVNVGSKWDRVLDNIQRLRKARDINKSQLIINGHMTVVGENVGEIPLFIKNYKDFGFDRIDFGYDPKVLTYLRCNPKLKLYLRIAIKKVLDLIDEPEQVDLSGLKYLDIH